MNENFSIQSISTLMGEKKAFINKKGDVDTGKILSVTVDEYGIDKILIKGSTQATITMEQVYETVETALRDAIELGDIQVKELQNHVASLRGRLQNVQEEDTKSILSS